MGKLLINIHGFLSSHESEKIQLFRQRLKEYSDIQYLSPSLPDNPMLAVKVIDKIIEDNKSSENITLIGHSLGGYYATHLAIKHNLNAVLVNPVVRGYEIMCEFFGEQSNPHAGSNFHILEEDIDFLIKIYIENLNDHSKFLVMQKLGDEIIDPRDTLEYYNGCKIIEEEDGNHDFTDFSRHTKSIINFAFGNLA